MKFKKESHYLELGDTGSTTNLSNNWWLMKNLKIINQQQLKDWAKEIFKKILLIWLMFLLKKKLLEEH